MCIINIKPQSRHPPRKNYESHKLLLAFTSAGFLSRDAGSDNLYRDETYILLGSASGINPIVHAGRS